MKIRSFTKHLCLLLALVLLLGLAPQPVSSAQPAQVTTQSNQTDLAATVEEQIRAFVVRLNRPDADDIAASELAQHGLSGGGEKLVADKTHPLTATLFNSELLLDALKEGCTAAIQTMQVLQMERLPYVFGTMNWMGANSRYYMAHQTEEGHSVSAEKHDFRIARANPYTGKRNGYDGSLEWITGHCYIHMDFQRTNITDNEITYAITCTVYDRFDLTTASGDGFKDWISELGQSLFREFDWESIVTFELTVPYTCTHSSANYHWTYNASSHTMTAEGSGDSAANTVTTHRDGSKYYYELNTPVHLNHDQPWVMEYDIKNPGDFVLSPLSHISSTSQKACLFTQGSTMLSFCLRKEGHGTAEVYPIRDFYGTPMDGLFSFSASTIYTYRLENEIHSDGSNMVYLTILDTATGDVVLNKTAMDDHYQYSALQEETTKHSDADNWVSGKDVVIQYIGNQEYPFSADYFDLRIWENGKEGTQQTYYQPGAVTAPACTEGGHTTYTCTACGHSYNSDFTDPVGHSFGSWRTEMAAGCDSTGTEGRDCDACGFHETRETEPVGHIWDEGKVIIAPTEDSTGVKQLNCQVCGKQTTQTIPVLGHTHNYKKDVTHPTCLEGGSTTFTCECGDTYVGDYTDPKGHNYKNLVVSPTCQETGYTTHTCTRCGDSYTDSETPISDHNWNAGEVVVPATEQTTGVRMYTCIYCGETRTEVIPLVPHMHKYAPTVTEPTCTTPGYTTNTCACGDSYVDNETEPLPHPYGEDGLCTVCGAKEPEPVEPEPTDPPPTEPTEPAPTDPPRPKPEPVRPSEEERHQVMLWLIIAGCMGFVCVLCMVIVLIFQFRKIPKRKKPKKDEKKSEEKPAEKMMKK